MKNLQVLLFILITTNTAFTQLKWKNVDSLYQPLPPSVHVFFSDDSLDGKPNIAYYVEAELKDKKLDFTTQVGNGTRYTPTQYYTQESNPLIVVNATFFEFVNNTNLNVVVNKGKLLSYNNHTIAGRGKDTLIYRHPFISAIGITKKRKADIAWTYTDSSKRFVYATQTPIPFFKDSSATFNYMWTEENDPIPQFKSSIILNKWYMQTAIGGGPVLVQNGMIKITNNEELKFTGKAIDDKHPRTTMGYTQDGKLIILMFEGRNAGVAEGATLKQAAQILKDIGCFEALNLDGGGSSCLLINGKETIKPSDKEGQRPVPAVFMIKRKGK